MREAVGIPAGLLVYFLTTTILLLLVQATIAEPQEWQYLITAAIAVIAFKLTCATVINFSTETGVAIVAVIIVAFWLLSLGFDVFVILDAIIKFLSVDPNSPDVLESFKDLANAALNRKVCLAISFVLAIRTFSE